MERKVLDQPGLLAGSLPQASLAKPHHRGSRATSPVNLGRTPAGERPPEPPPGSQTMGTQRSTEKSRLCLTPSG